MAKVEKRIATALERIADVLEKIEGKFKTVALQPAKSSEENPAKASSSSKAKATTKSSKTALSAKSKESTSKSDSAPDTGSADGADGESSGGPTASDVKQALVSLQKAAGSPKQSIALLKKFGATTVPKLKPDTYAGIIAAAEKAEKKL